MSSMGARSEPIAIVGSGCRFPGGANSPSKLWNLLVEKRDALREIDSSRFNPQGFYHSNGERHGCINITKAYTLEEDVRAFDASFFGINPKEAEAIDPQHRILLETVYEAMEAGGFSIEGMRASDTAVYVGVMTGDYLELLLRSPHTMPKYVATGTAASILSNRISYFFDWKGPSVTVNTACSSSLVAVHHAVQSLRSGESRMALAGGSNLILNPEFMIGECNLHMLSPDGRSRMWDAGANGYARGEGFAAVLMKKLSDAIADRDDIQCIIRETGVNSDGRTQGITLPSPQAQTKLIREVYQRAGLNPLASTDRCQFFEAHGTGTPAGDPLEATGIRDAFFPQSENADPQHDGTMLVGSIKTAVGHTEGTAGLAGLIKAAQALKRGVIPPNMLFEKLNPKLSPLTSNLKIAAEEQPWPSLPLDVPRRASVNSFGFGGTNAHAIVESYDPPASPVFLSGMDSLPLAIPLVFSANSERSLTTMIASYKSYIEQNLSVCLNDMAWTLQNRRSEFPVKAHFSGPSREELLSQMEGALVKANKSPPGAVGHRSPGRPSKARIFGVFTGQGAQWANMGRDLILASSMARDTIIHLEDCLKGLPDGPSWSLMQELTDKDRPSRLDEAELAQPISTAVQVMVINILQSAGVSFAAVVGHSSGEISAAYAAGVITASEAIKIAYYRGYHSKLSKGANEQPGAMLAAGLSFDDATEFCSEPAISDRVVVAASNAPQSVTLSGDIDAIHTAKALLDKNKIFNRMLKVNKAYHSHHMEPCSQAYIYSLKSCGIDPKYPRNGCLWVSSVFGDRIEEAASLESLASTYWNDNMLKPVLFSMAIEQTMQIDSKYDMALEIGPHPALKGPALQTIKAATNSSLSYGATLTRGVNDIAALSGTFGFLMEHMPNASLKVDKYVESFQSNVSPRLLTDLPTYAWDHSQTFWSESRYSKNYRLRNKARHDLLGERYPDDLEHDMRWRNTIRVSETPWLAGHKIQGQIVYPAAAYLVMALEASKDLAGSGRVSLIELLDVEISRAIPLEDDASGVDTLFTLRKTHEGVRQEAKVIEANFGCFSCVGEQAEGWDVNARGSIRLTFGEDANQPLGKRDSRPVLLNPLNVTTFYDFLKDIGFEYTGLFRRLDTIDRRMNRATSMAVEYPEAKEMSAMVHPALLDAAFQSVFAALQYPGDGSMSAPYVPTNIKSIRMTAGSKHSEERQIAIESFITSNNGSDIVGDIEMYDAKTGNATIHVEGLTCTSLDRPRPSNDMELYAQNVWKADISDRGLGFGLDHRALLPELGLVQLCERLSSMYLRQIHAAMSGHDISSYGPHHQCVFEWADRLLPVVQSGQHPTIAERWASENSEQLMEEVSKHPNMVDLNAIQMIGRSLLASLNEKAETVDHGLSESFVQSYFDYGLGMNHANTVLGKIVNQIAHRYPGMRILDVNAGNTATTKSVLAEVRDAFKSYTVAQRGADPSAGTLEGLKSWGTRLKFQSLDLEGDIVAQGYEGAAYDLVIATNSLYAASNQSDAIRNARKLLKPGGHLLLLESTGELQSTRFVRSGLPAYWPSHRFARRYEPPNSVSQWTFILEENGFSGVDQIVNDTGNDPRQTVSVMLSQAVNDQIDFLRSPSTPPALAFSVGSICFIGRNQRRNADVTSYLLRSFKRLNSGFPKIIYLDRIENVMGCSEPITSVIFLQDLDEPIWRSLSEEMLRAFKKLLSEARHILWVTSGCRLENPYANMSVGMGRGLQAEYSHIRFQLLDVDPKSLPFSNHLLAGTAMRLIGYDSIKASTPDMLWTLEPEMVIEEGKVMIPRVITDINMNNRLNARRRSIKKTIRAQGSRIVVEEFNGLYRLSEPDVALCTTQSSSEAIIRVEQILLSTIRISEFAHAYLCIGEIAESRVSASIGTRVLAFTDTISSTARIPMSHIFTLSDNAKSDALFLQAVAAVLLADIALSQLQYSSTILVFESDNALSKVFERRARDRGHEILRASSKVATTETGIIHIDAHAPLRKTKAQLPRNIDLLLNFGDEGALDFCLKKTVIIINVNSLFGQSSQALLGAIPKEHGALLEEAQTLAPQFIEDVSRIPVTTPSEISADPTNRPHLSVIDLTRETDMTITVAPIDPQTLFRSNRTYLLVGCTGGLGQSLCRWMVANGARHLALTSRNPKSVNQIWLDELRSMGGNPQIFETDVVNAAALEKTYAEINSRMPPIAGVANAAMVLSDSLFDDIKYEDFSKVLKPKVEGTANLDRLFGGRDLDFFILFSSFASSVGNRGQTNYLAANMYMATIAAQRRTKGLAASVMHIGMVLGLGVVFQTGLYETTMKRLNYMPISEPGFLDMFAQSIVVGRPDSGYSNEFITGLGRLSTRADAPKPFYASNVRFSHHVLQDDEESSAEVSGASVSLAQRLAAAKAVEEQSAIIQDVFVGKLERILQSSRDQIHASQGLIALGVDSLMAVEVRSWFLSELEVDMPVLKLLGGASISEICAEAAKSRPHTDAAIENSPTAPVVQD
ncbi:MAG: hypothetical protein L6R39_005464, partial [Caloplaca ligustica]